MGEQEKVHCPSCSKDFSNNFDKYSIQAFGRCVDCQKAWNKRPENDPDMKKFRVKFTFSGYEIVLAKNEQEAAEVFDDDYEGNIDDIEEVK